MSNCSKDCPELGGCYECEEYEDCDCEEMVSKMNWIKIEDWRDIPRDKVILFGWHSKGSPERFAIAKFIASRWDENNQLVAIFFDEINKDDCFMFSDDPTQSATFGHYIVLDKVPLDSE